MPTHLNVAKLLCDRLAPRRSNLRTMHYGKCSHKTRCDHFLWKTHVCHSVLWNHFSNCTPSKRFHISRYCIL